MEEGKTIQWLKEKKTKGQTMIYKTLHGKLRIKQQKPTKKLDELSCS
jgi:hypothetical protein